ncbi:MAG: cysteine--tRNA ligase [Dehalococcoidia bacterium]
MKIYNTLSGRKEEFVPHGDEVKMYVCGVTPYDSCHIGHAMSYIIFDMVRRYLRFRGYEVKYVQNFTDIDDKIIARANERGISARDMAEEFIREYFEDMDALNIMRADVYPYATDMVPDIIRVVETLIEKGFAYELNGDVYFRVRKADSYGKLSHRNLDDLRAGARIEVDEAKEYALDFAVWKAAKPGEPSWESPWGPGRPGWHIECSVMSQKYLGDTLDIHGGGQDLIFPHHENEIAQSEAFTGVIPFVKYWMHNGLLQMDQEKMSKSLGNLITVKELRRQVSADALRLFMLSSHYRSPLSYTDEGLEAMERGADRLTRTAQLEENEEGETSIDANPYWQRFIEAMDDDFNSAQAVAALFDLAREVNRGWEEGAKIGEAQNALRELAGVLGLKLEEVRREFSAGPFVDLLVDIRNQLRAERKFELADMIRDRLAELGIALEDSAQGTRWRQER